jgi:hypothetical protein
MLLLWKEDIAYWKVGLGYAPDRHWRRLRGHAGIAFPDRIGAGPASWHGLRDGGSPARPRRGDHAVDLGAVLTAGYASAVGAAVAASPDGDKVTDNVQAELTKSFSSAVDTAQRYPQYQSQIIAAAKESFLQGDQWAYLAGIIAIVLGALLVFFLFPRKDAERALLAQYHAEDTQGAAEPVIEPPVAAPAS